MKLYKLEAVMEIKRFLVNFCRENWISKFRHSTLCPMWIVSSSLNFSPLVAKHQENCIPEVDENDSSQIDVTELRWTTRSICCQHMMEMSVFEVLRYLSGGLSV